MAKKYIEEVIVEEVKVPAPVFKDHSREVLEARQKELLALLDQLTKENVRSIGDVEVKLSIVNRDLAAL